MDEFLERINSLEKVLETAKQTFDKNAERRAYNSLGFAYYSAARYGDAEHNFRQSLLVATEIGDRYGEGTAYGNLGAVYQSLGKYEEAINSYKKCLSIAVETADKDGESIAYGNLGAVYESLGNHEEAINFHEKCLRIAMEIGDKNGEGTAYGNLGVAYQSLGKYEEAMKFYEKHFNIALDMGDEDGEGRACGYLGGICQSLGNYEEAVKFYEKSLGKFIEIGNKNGEGKVCGNLGDVYRSFGKYQEAIKFHKKCLNIAAEIGDKDGEGEAYGNLGAVYRSLGKYEEARRFHQKHLSIAIEIGDKNGEGTAYGSLGVAYESLGKYREAIKCHEKSLSTAVELGEKKSEGIACGNLGSVYHSVGKYDEAIKFHQKRLSISTETDDKDGEGAAYGGLGSAYWSLGKYKEATESHDKCLNIAKEIGNKEGEGAAYGNLGTVYLALGKYEEALKFHQQSLTIAIEIGDKNGEAKVYGNLAAVYRSLGKYEEVLKCYEKCLSIVIDGGDKAGQGLTLHNLGVHFFHLGGENRFDNVKKAAGYFADALQCFELVFDDLGSYDKFKISILDTFVSTYRHLIQILAALDQKEEALLVSERARARALDDLLVSKYSMNQRNVCRSKLNTFKDMQKIFEKTKCSIVVFTLSVDYVVSWILEESKSLVFHRNKIERLKNIPYLENESLEEVIKQAFNEIGVRKMVNCEDRSLNTLEVNYKSGNDEPFLLKDKDILGRLERKVSEMNMGVRCIEPPDEENGTDCLEVLYEMLIAPVQVSLLQDEIVLVPDGALFKVPFAALRDPSTKAFLTDTKRIRIVPSLTTLKVLEDSPADYHVRTSALVIGNPAVWEVMVEGEKKEFCLLPGAELEAKEISSLLGVKPLTGDKATKQEVLRKLQDGVGIVHMATHGSAKGQILLAPSPSVRGVPDVKDCILTMDEIQEVGLRAQLVVLSCCHTGRGEIRAEGVVGLTRAFLAAGARAVVASLWAIDDEATKVFMVHFYSHLKRGESASMSLQQAMKEMRMIPCYSEPRYWAAFFLIGDDVTIVPLSTQDE